MTGYPREIQEIVDQPSQMFRLAGDDAECAVLRRLRNGGRVEEGCCRRDGAEGLAELVRDLREKGTLLLTL